MDGSKGNKVLLSTFLKWSVDNIIGYKTIEAGGCTYVYYVWCKVCARNKSSIMQHPNCKGKVKDSLKKYIEGTNFVTKHTVTRHILIGEGHRIAVRLEEEKPSSERITTDSTGVKSKSSFPTINLL